MTRNETQQLWRVANDIHNASAQQTHDPIRLDDTWHQCRKLEARLKKVNHATAKRLDTRKYEATCIFERTVYALQDAYIEYKTVRDVKLASITTKDVMNDLVSMRRAYGDRLEIDMKSKKLVLLSNPVILRDIEFGRFRLTLGYTQYPIYHHVKPLDPIYSREGNYFHPHVDSGGEFCLGSAEKHVPNLLKLGQVQDAFVLMTELLHTYNEDSPFAPIDTWSEDYKTCSGCSDPVSEEEEVYCEPCNEYYCSYCTESCEHCGERRCCTCSDEHLEQCMGCPRKVCWTSNDCGDTCEGCEEFHCRRCLNESQLCASCVEKQALEKAEELENVQ